MADPIYLLDPGGEVVTVPPEQVESAATLGYTPATQKQIEEALALKKRHEELGGVGGALLAGAASTASALTLGLSDLALTKSGLVAPETLKGLEEANPIASGLGTAVGIAGPIVAGALTGGAAPAVAGAAKLAAPSVISKAGSAVTRTVAGALEREGAGLGARVLGRAAALGAGSAVEGAAYGLGQVVHESALGDPNLTAQKILAFDPDAFRKIGLTVAGSAGLGAILGGTIGAAEVAIPAAVKRAASFATETVQKAKEAYPALAERLSGGQVTAEEVKRLQAGFDKAFKSPKEVIALQRELGDSVEELVNRVQAARRVMYEQARPVETAELIRAVPADKLGDRVAAQRVLDAFKEGIDKIVADPDLYEVGYARKLAEIADGIVRRASGDPVEVFELLRTARQQIEPYAKFGGKSLGLMPFKEREAVQVARGIRSVIRDAITDESAWGPAAARQAALDEAHSDFQQALETLRKGKLGPLGGSIVREVPVKGGTEYRVNPRALKTFLNQMGDPRAEQIVEPLTDLLGSAQRYAGQMEETFSHLPTADFQKGALTDLVDRASKATQQAMEQGEITRALNDLNPNAQFQAGGARALMPPGTTGGAASGLGTLAAAPLIGHMIPGAGPVAAVYGAAKAGYHIMEGVKNVPQTIATLSKLERAAQAVSNRIDSGLAAIVNASSRAEAIGRSEAAAGIARSFGKSLEDAAPQFLKKVAQVNTLANDPEQLQGALVKQTEDWHDHAPNTAQAMNTATARLVQFLASKVPGHAPQGILAPAWEPSSEEIARFNRYYEAATNPLAILKQASAGTLTAEAIEAVQAVHPQLFAEIQQRLVERLTKPGISIPYRQRLMLSQLLGVPVDGSTLPANVAAHQVAINQPTRKPSEQMPMVPPKTNAKGLGNVTLAQRTLMPHQHR